MPEHNLLVGSQLHEPFHFISATDPGAVGAGKWWIQIPVDQSAGLIYRRNLANTAWIPTGGGSGGGGLSWTTAPLIATTSTSAGAVAYDSNYLYIATSINHWRRLKFTQFAPEGIFTFSSSGDEFGTIYFLGTNLNQNTNWTNPHTATYVTAVLSSVGVGGASELVDRTINDLYTGNAANSWMSIDLGVARTLIPNYYSIRARSSTSGGGIHPRTWKFQGSNNAVSNSVVDLNAATWVDLNIQTSNTTLTTINQWLSLPVSGVVVGYRWFRIFQTGVNSGGSNFLAMAELELYGTLTF